MKFWKKGISPLIATVLIIGFTVALAAVIMTWGTTFSKGMQKSAEESANVQLICSKLEYTLKSACAKDDNTIKLTVSSESDRDILNLTVRLYKSAAEFNGTLPLLDKLEAHGLRPYDVVWEGQAKNVKMIELVPTIAVAGERVPCSTNIERYGDLMGTPLPSC